MKGQKLWQALWLSLSIGLYAELAHAQKPQSPPPPVEAQPEEAEAEATVEPSPDLSQRLPVGSLQIDGQAAPIPDWQVVAFNSFPAFPADGQWGDVSWSKGDRLADVMTLGDFQSLDLHLLTLASIADSLGIPTRQMGREYSIYQIPLSEFRLLERQTIADLVRAVPALLDVSIHKLPLIRDIVTSVRPTFSSQGQTLQDVLVLYPGLVEVKLSEQILEGYRLADLPGIELVPLQAFAGWQDAAISEVPLLPVMSWWLFPRKPNIDGEIAVLSVNPRESGDHSLTLTPRSVLEPAEWVAGEEVVSSALQSQIGSQVSGEQAQINGGREPNGAFPFGPAFKVVPTAITPEGIQMSMYFRTCRQATELDCSAYGIGPIPLTSYVPGQTMFVGEGLFLPRRQSQAIEAIAPQPTPAPPASEDFFSVVINTAATHKGPISAVVIILSLAGGVIYWAIQGDPVKFLTLTFRWSKTRFLSQPKKTQTPDKH